MNTLFFLEMALFSGVVIIFGVREIIMLSPENVAKQEAKDAARRAKWAAEDAAKSVAKSPANSGHAEG
jgi:hypothetical protein